MGPDLVCFGAVHWDIIGRPMNPRDKPLDVPGDIRIRPGGVVCRVGLALRMHGVMPAILSAVGNDFLGFELVRQLDQLGLDTSRIAYSEKRPTGTFLALEDCEGSLNSVSDCTALEYEAPRLLRSLFACESPSGGEVCGLPVVLDGNLPARILEGIVDSDLLAGRRLIFVAASGAKAGRAAPLAGRARTVLYMNLHEANQLSGRRHESSMDAAESLVEMGFERVVVTDSGNSAADRDANASYSARPSILAADDPIGAGDRFAAAHIAAERSGAGRRSALSAAHEAVGRELDAGG